MAEILIELIGSLISGCASADCSCDLSSACGSCPNPCDVLGDISCDNGVLGFLGDCPCCRTWECCMNCVHDGPCCRIGTALCEQRCCCSSDVTLPAAAAFYNPNGCFWCCFCCDGDSSTRRHQNNNNSNAGGGIIFAPVAVGAMSGGNNSNAKQASSLQEDQSSCVFVPNQPLPPQYQGGPKRWYSRQDRHFVAKKNVYEDMHNPNVNAFPTVPAAPYFRNFTFGDEGLQLIVTQLKKFQSAARETLEPYAPSNQMSPPECAFLHICSIDLRAQGITDTVHVTALLSNILLPNIRTVNLGQNSITTPGVKALAAFLLDDTCRVETLLLAGNKLSSEGYYVVCTAAAECASLRHLELGASPEDVAPRLIVEDSSAASSLAQLIKGNSKSRLSSLVVCGPLHWLGMKGGLAIADALCNREGASVLQELSLVNLLPSRVTGAAGNTTALLEAFAASLRTATISSLSLRLPLDNRDCAAAVGSIAASATRLRSLQLANCLLSPLAVQHLSSALQGSCSLVSLDISRPSPSVASRSRDVGVLTPLLRSLNVNRTLTELVMCGIELTEPDICEMIGVLERNTVLRCVRHDAMDTPLAAKLQSLLQNNQRSFDAPQDRFRVDDGTK